MAWLVASFAMQGLRSDRVRLPVRASPTGEACSSGRGAGPLRGALITPRVGHVADYTAQDYYGAYLPLLVMLVVGSLLVVAMFTANRLLRPTYSTPEKLLTYECGVDPVGEGWAQHHVRYYVFAYLYVIFAVDAVFLFPWAVVLEDIGRAAAVEMAIFIGILVVGLAYAWRKGVLSWTS